MIMYHIPFDHGAYALTATLSIISCASVILTLIVFEKMRSKLFMRFIAFMALGDIFGCIPYLYTWTFPQSSPWCVISGIWLQTGSVSAWLWTASLCFMWHRASTKTLRGITWHVMPLFHCFCWGVPLSFTLPSLALSPFENSSTFDGVCAPYGTYKARLYHNVWSYLLFVACLVFMAALYGHLLYLDRDKHSRNSEVSVAHNRNVAAAKSTLVCYPVLFIIFWLPKMILTTVYELAYSTGNKAFDKSMDFFLCWYMLHGVAVAIVFFYNSPMARQLWRHRAKMRLIKLGILKGSLEGDEDRGSFGSRSTQAHFPSGIDDNYLYDEDADSVADYRSTYADPADIEMRSSLSRHSAGVPRGISLVSSTVPRPSGTQFNMVTPVRPSVTLAGDASETTSAQESLPDVETQVLSETNLVQNSSQASESVQNPIMNQWLHAESAQANGHGVIDA